MKKLRFKIGDFVVSKYDTIYHIAGYNHCCGGQDYTVNYLEEWGSFSSCYGANDEKFVGLHKIQDMNKIRKNKKEEWEDRKRNGALPFWCAK